MTEPTSHPLWPTQLDLEARMVSDGVDKFRAALAKATEKGSAADKGAARRQVLALVNPVATALQNWIEHVSKGRGRRPQALPVLSRMDPHVAAFVAIKSAFNLLATGSRRSMPIQSLANDVGRALEAEDMVLQFQQAKPEYVKAVLKALDRTTSHRQHRRRVLVAAMHRESYTPTAWGHELQVLVGKHMLELILENTSLLQTFMAARMHRVSFSSGVWELMVERNAHLELLEPRLVPCVVPPRPWDGTCKGGGYWTSVLPLAMPLVKTGRAQARKTAVSDTVLTAVNAIQDTAWAVNKRVLEVMREVVDRGLDDLDVLPPIRELGIPTKPVDIATNETARKEYCRNAAKAHGFNVSIRSKRVQVIKTLSVAEEFSAFERIYFPHQLDFRGRAYALPQWLNPQGPDYAKGLLTFAEGKPIGDGQGPGWLAIHGANCFGVDKVGLEDRIQWIEDYEHLVKRVADDPLSELWWTEADQPWCFLSFCFEWADYRRMSDQGEGASFVSRLPVMVDGTCNGLQHYSAMLRDPIGGAATNLVPSDRPQDIYGRVAERVAESLYYDAMAAEHPSLSVCDNASEIRQQADWAATWGAFGIDRKITKRSVMVLPYGGTFMSCRDYVRQAVEERGCPYFGSAEEAAKATQYLATLVWQSIGDVVVAARQGMDWLQKATRLASHNGIEELWWTTPAGFEARQSYKEMDYKVLDTTFMGSRIQLRLEAPTDRLNKRRQAAGIAPNFVHSLDAAAMQLTIELALDNGVGSFAMVHDSYGTLAADMPMLSACLRQAFVQMYRDHDVLAELRDLILQRLPEKQHAKLPPLPPMGDLDLSAVIQSDFFFA
jgi:DNA-directed RNA polymerase